MSKRTTRNESSESPTPSPRRRKAADTAEPAAPAAKVTRTRRKAAEPVEATAPFNGHSYSAAVGKEALDRFDAAAPSYEQIATRAYFIALERGFQTDPLADWLLAERELRGASA